MEKTLADGLVLADMIPVIAGDFELTVLVQNSVNNEFATFSERVRVPAEGKPAVFGPLVSYRLQAGARAVFSAFATRNLQASPDPQRTFGEQEPLQALLAVDHGDAGTDAPPEVVLSSVPAAGAAPVSRRLQPRSSGGARVQTYSVDLGTLPAGYYRLRASLRDAAGSEIAGDEANFTVSRLPAVSHPAVASPSVPAAREYAFRAMLAAQYEASGRPGEAERAYEEALRQGGGDSPPLRAAFARFLLAQAKPERALEVAAALPEQGTQAFDRFALRGKALYRLGRWQEAVDELLRANALYDSDVSVLNALGLSLLRLGNPQEARKALSASLRIKAAQPDIAAVLKQTEAP